MKKFVTILILSDGSEYCESSGSHWILHLIKLPLPVLSTSAFTEASALLLIDFPLCM